MEKAKVDLSSMAKKWPSAFVVRDKAGQFSGGMVSPGYLKNLDSKGKGPEGRIRVGRRVAYPVGSLISWLEARAEVL